MLYQILYYLQVKVVDVLPNAVYFQLHHKVFKILLFKDPRTKPKTITQYIIISYK